MKAVGQDSLVAARSGSSTILVGIVQALLSLSRLHNIAKWKILTNQACFVATKSHEPAQRMSLASMVTVNTAIAKQGLVQARQWETNQNSPIHADRGGVGS